MLGKRQRLLVDPRLLIGVYQVPIDVLDLRDGRNRLIFESDVRDFFVVLRDCQVAQIGPKTESRQQLLLEREAVHRIQHGGQIEEWTVRGLTAVVKFDCKASACRKGLGVGNSCLSSVRLQRRYTV